MGRGIMSENKASKWEISNADRISGLEKKIIDMKEVFGANGLDVLERTIKAEKEIARLEEKYTALAHNINIKLARIEKNYEKHRLETARLVKSNNDRNWSYMNTNLKRLEKEVNELKEEDNE